MKIKHFVYIASALLLASCSSGGSTSTSTSSSSTSTSSSTTSSSSSSSTSISSSTSSSSSSSSTSISSSTTSSSTSSSTSQQPAKGFNVTFVYDEHVVVTVYTTKEYTVVDPDLNYQTRNGETGEYCDDGVESQINFKIVASDGFEVESISASEGTYNKIKWPVDTEVENGYRVTKITADTTITITSKSTEAEPEGHKVEFVLSNCSIQVHIGKDTSSTDTPDQEGYYYTRDKDTGEYCKTTSAQVNFTIVPAEGYTFVSGIESGGDAKAKDVSYISGSYNKLKNNDDCWFTVTQVSSDLVITLSCVAK